MKICIIGASGLVGGNCLQLLGSKTEHEVVGTYFSFQTDNTVYFNTLDLKDKDNFDIVSFEPDVIIHCGALTHVDYCETNETESFTKTVQSTINLLQLANKLKARLIYISTDYVFDGKEGPYSETDKVNPISIYGRHKLQAEQLVMENDQNLVLRITNVYGDEERSKNFVSRIVDQIKNGQVLKLNLPYDQYATPVNAADIAQSIYLLLSKNKKGIYNIAGTDYVNRVQLAQRILKYFPEAKYELRSMSTDEINPPAKRPLQGGLKSAKFLKEFPEFAFSNVDDYIQKLKHA